MNFELSGTYSVMSNFSLATIRFAPIIDDVPRGTFQCYRLGREYFTTDQPIKNLLKGIKIIIMLHSRRFL